MTLERLIRTKKAVVGVIGLGYVGLPLARLFATKGFRTFGFDIDEAKVGKLRRGESTLKSVDAATLKRIKPRFEATSDFSRLPEADAVLICVPTPLHEDGRPDLSFIKSTAGTVAKRLRKDQLVVLESTTYPGTTREILKPKLDARGVRYFLAFSPEREDPGNTRFTNADIPKLVGGVDERSGRLAEALYASAVVRAVRVSSPEIAEAAKLLENIYRGVNIALVNELKVCFEKMGLDIWEAIAAASTKPFGFQAFHPGPGLGGQCVPVAPAYLAWSAKRARASTPLVDLAGRVNAAMPRYVVGRVKRALGRRSLKGARVLALGVAYKKDVDDPRASPAFPILRLLDRAGAKAVAHDPLVTTHPRRVELSARTLAAQDVVVIVTDHSAYDYAWIVKHAKRVVDTRDACRDVRRGREKITRA